MNARTTEQMLLVSFCALFVVPLLYLGRQADTNTLSSWSWAFSATGMLQAFGILVLALPCAYALSRLRLAQRAPALLAVLAVAAVLPLWQAPEAVIDASRYFVQAKSLSEYGLGYFLSEWGRAIHAWTDMPLVPLLYGLMFKWFGEARIVIQIWNTLLFALTCHLTFLIGRRLWDAETGLNAGLLLLAIPYLLVQVPLMLVDVPTMFFLSLALYAFLNAIEKGGAAWTGLASVALFAALFSKYSAWLMLGVIPVTAFALAPADVKATLRRSAAVLCVAALLAGALVCLRFDLFQEQIVLLGSYQWPALGGWQEGYASTFLFQSHPFVALLALLGAYTAFRRKERRFLVAAWFAAFVFVLQVKRIRYILPLFPLFALMAAYGLNALRDPEVRRYICLCAVASSMIIAYCAYLPFLNSTSMGNLQRAGRYLDSLECDAVDVYALPQTESAGSTFAAIPLLDYHTRKHIRAPQAWPAHPAGGDTARSSLRFTWEAARPELYSKADAANGCALAVISSAAVEGVPAALAAGSRGAFEELKRFDLVSGVFRYQTLVTVFRRR